ncbi:unnamed protein product, partial [Staurois parvus]
AEIGHGLRTILQVSHWRPSSCCETTSPIMPLPLEVMLVTVNLAMPHGTCSFTTAGGPPV